VRCRTCLRPLATDGDYAATQPGEREDLCWSAWGSQCDPRDEVALIVRYLREDPVALDPYDGAALRAAADAIERGDHLDGVP